jgi:bifunctional non-homologous end joining protein LigD
MAVKVQKRRPAKDALHVASAQPAPFPDFIPFCDPTLTEVAPVGDEWLYELKIDGYRAQVHIDGGDVTVYSRRGHDWTEQFAPVSKGAAKLRVTSAVIDGEAAAFGASGRPDFQALRRQLGNPNSTRLVFHAFDLLYLNGMDLRPAELIDRKKALQSILKSAPPSLVYLDYLEANESIFDTACRMGLEGIVAKRKDAPYHSGRTERWVKLKCVKTDTFPIVAFVEKLGAKPRRIASLYVGRHQGDKLLYAGKVQTGYSLQVAREVRERLDPFIRKSSPLSVPVKKPKATWVQPAVNAEVAYSDITDDGLLRAAVFKGLRDDLDPPRRRPPSIVRSSKEDEAHGVPRENILQLLPDAVVPSKEELKDYWTRVAKKALVHLGNRPLKLVRNTRGATFYHKGKLPTIPKAVHQLSVEKRSGGQGVRVWVDDLEGLLGLVQMDAVELHPWNATVDDIERADRIVFDLDPGKGVPWEAVIEAALATRDLLLTKGLGSWPKVTGGKGLHIMAPVRDKISHDEARRFAHALMQRLAKKDQKRYLLSSAPGARSGRIFLDYLRHGRGNTAAGAYSPRVRAGFPIAAPVTWSQVEKGITADAFTMGSPFRRQTRPKLGNRQPSRSVY